MKKYKTQPMPGWMLATEIPSEWGYLLPRVHTLEDDGYAPGQQQCKKCKVHKPTWLFRRANENTFDSVCNQCKVTRK